MDQINVDQINDFFALSDKEREEFRQFIVVLEGVMARDGRDDTTEGVVRYLQALLDREPLAKDD